MQVYESFHYSLINKVNTCYFLKHIYVIFVKNNHTDYVCLEPIQGQYMCVCMTACML